jgi:hypothetical protein
VERRYPAVCNDSDKKRGKGETKEPICLQDLRGSLYVKAKAEPTWRFWGLYVHVSPRPESAIVSTNQASKEEPTSVQSGRKGCGPWRTSFHSTLAQQSAGKPRVPSLERCTRSNPPRYSSKLGAVCGKAARTVLSGGRSAMVVPTATVMVRLEIATWTLDVNLGTCHSCRMSPLRQWSWQSAWLS